MSKIIFSVQITVVGIFMLSLQNQQSLCDLQPSQEGYLVVYGSIGYWLDYCQPQAVHTRSYIYLSKDVHNMWKSVLIRQVH